MRVLPSVAKLTEILRQPFTRKIDRAQIGRQVSDRWELGSRLIVGVSESLRSSPERVFHVRYKDLVRDPFAIVVEIYRHFDLELSERGSQRIKRAIAGRPNGGYGRNLYRFEEYGLSSANERKRFSEYMSHFGMQPEEPSDRVVPDANVRLAV